jgi:hypothetical protein
VLPGQPAAEPGPVVCVHTFGNLQHFYPLTTLDTFRKTVEILRQR